VDLRISLMPRALRDHLDALSRAPDGKPRPDAPFGRGPMAARVLARVIDGAAAVGSRLPVSVAHALAVLGGHVEWCIRTGKRRRLATNLAHAAARDRRSPAVRRLVRREIVNEARRSADLLWAIGRPRAFLDSVEVTGMDRANETVAAGRGLVIAGVHLGGWELAAAIPGEMLTVPTTVIVADNWLAWAMQHVRSRSGMRVVYHAAPTAMARALRRGEAVVVIGDDSWGDRPRLHRVRFCDSTARLPAGIVALAQMTGAAIMPFTIVSVAPRRWRVTMEPPIEPPARHADGAEVVDVLQRLADRWTASITAHVDQWAASFAIAWDEP
jgi:lauroyl/myristoyl acyltransferase